MIHDYAVAYFDILGFGAKFNALGLPAIAEKYRALMRVVDNINEHSARLTGDLFRFKESVYWTSEGDVVPVVKVHGAYASDSILIWSHAAWPEARGKTDDECHELAQDPGSGWVYQTVPCDTFLRTCNEIVCAGLELDLPLRGSISKGKAILDSTDRVFLGQPLIDAARLEKGQKFIGASYCPSFMEQVVPKQFRIPFSEHLKDGYQAHFGGEVLDWPRHWRKTRKEKLNNVISSLRDASGGATEYYDNTLSSIGASDTRQHSDESASDLSLRSVYPAFSSPHLEAHAIAVRTATK